VSLFISSYILSGCLPSEGIQRNVRENGLCFKSICGKLRKWLMLERIREAVFALFVQSLDFLIR